MRRILSTLLMAILWNAVTGCEARVDPIPSPAPRTEGAAPDDPTGTGPAATGPTTQASASLTIANRHCAVMSEHEIDPKVTINHAGRTIAFCCPDCIETFQKDPSKYLASLK